MKRIKSVLKYLLSYFPENLPVGMTAYNQFCNDIIELAGPYADKDSMRFVISTNILHLDPKYSRASKQYFVRRLRKTAANQIVSEVINEIKAAQLKKQAEATAKPVEVVASGEKA